MSPNMPKFRTKKKHSPAEDALQGAGEWPPLSSHGHRHRTGECTDFDISRASHSSPPNHEPETGMLYSFPSSDQRLPQVDMPTVEESTQHLYQHDCRNCDEMSDIIQKGEDYLQACGLRRHNSSPARLHSAEWNGNEDLGLMCGGYGDDAWEQTVSDSELDQIANVRESCKTTEAQNLHDFSNAMHPLNRRSRIGDGIRKLQDIVPNIDKQAHMVDMLDAVVDYVSELQQQLKVLLENPNRCNGMCNAKTQAAAECDIKSKHQAGEI